jgi:hypothetical protein
MARHSALLFRLCPPSWFYSQTPKTAFLTLTKEQLYPGTKQGKNFVLHSPPKDIRSHTVAFFLIKNTTDNVQINNLKHTHNFTIVSQDLGSLFPISWSYYNCAHFWYPLYVLYAQSTMPANVRNKSINTPYWTYTTGVEFKAFRIITLFISGVNWWKSTTCQRTASRFWHTATQRIMYKKVVSDILYVSEISGLPQLQYLCNTENSRCTFT